MATKKGAGGEPQEYNKDTGRYGSGRKVSTKEMIRALVEAGKELPLDRYGAIDTLRLEQEYRKLRMAKISLDFFAFDDVKSLDNQKVREWYVEQVSKIHEQIDQRLPMEEKAKQAFETRNRIRTKARDMMEDQELRKHLDEQHPNLTFEERISLKMQQKHITREDAIADIYETAIKTNEKVNKELNIGAK